MSFEINIDRLILWLIFLIFVFYCILFEVKELLIIKKGMKLRVLLGGRCVFIILIFVI